MKGPLAIIIKVLAIFFCVGFTNVSSILKAQNTNIGAIDMPKCMVVLQYTETLPDALPDSIFNALAGITIYDVNRTELRPGDPFVRLLDTVILPLANNCDWTLLGMEVRGGASPEGTYDNNARLANGRAASILEYINQRLVHSRHTDEIKMSTMPEDYAYLLWMLERDGDPAAETLREIIARHGIEDHEAIKADMRKVDNGRYWKRLLTDYFPRARAGRVVLYFMPYRPTGEISPAPDPMLLDVEPLQKPQTFDLKVPELPKIEVPAQIERKHMLALGSNILYDLFYMPQYGWAPMPNVNLEIYPKRSNFTFRFQFLFPYYHRWNKHKFFQIRDYHFETRFYFHPGSWHTGWYLGAYVNTNKYGIGFRAKKGWQGEGGGAALKAGYVVPLGSGRWRLDFHVAVGGYYTRFDPYVYGNPVSGVQDGDYFYDYTGPIQKFRKRNHYRWWLGPTEVGVTLSLDLLYWRGKNNGASFRRKEVVEL